MIPLLNHLNKLGKPIIKKKIILFYTEDNAPDLTSSVCINIGETVVCPHSGKYISRMDQFDEDSIFPGYNLGFYPTWIDHSLVQVLNSNHCVLASPLAHED